MWWGHRDSVLRARRRSVAAIGGNAVNAGRARTAARLEFPIGRIANPSPPRGSVMVGAGSPSRLGITHIIHIFDMTNAAGSSVRRVGTSQLLEESSGVSPACYRPWAPKLLAPRGRRLLRCISIGVLLFKGWRAPVGSRALLNTTVS
jgi:hypothetical protein